MSSVPGVGSGSNNVKTRGNDLSAVDLNQFMDLMIAEMQNQDPLNPMDNSQFLQQITQIREIGATNQLTAALTSLSDSQSLATASTMIGHEITALGDDLQEVKGIVDRVSVERDENNEDVRITRLHVGDKKVQLKNVREILD